jgi:esterase/lipase
VKRRAGVVVGVAAAVAFGLWMRSHFAPEKVIARALAAAVEDFENEQVLGALAVVDHSYSDEHGHDYEQIGAAMTEVCDALDELEVDLEQGRAIVKGDEAELGISVVIWGSAEGQRGYVVGTPGDPASATLIWRKRRDGWRIVSAQDIHGFEEQ